MLKVFIAYSRKDREFAEKLEKNLSQEGVDVWLDKKKLLVGDSIIEKIETAINKSDYIIAVLSNVSVRSNWVKKELYWAIMKEQELDAKLVLPVKIEECDIPGFLKDKHYTDFSDPNNFIEPFYGLLDRLSITGIQDRCEHCKHNITLLLDRCPHCARSASPPNVRTARVPIERETLAVRYEAAMEDAAARGCEKIVRHFESAITSSKVIITSSVNEVARLAISESELYAHYISGVIGENFNPGDKTTSVDDLLFPGYKDQIRYATLSLSGIGLVNYGDLSLVLRDDLIAHRTSFFEENSVLFLENHKTILMANGSLPPGYRASWKDRGKLCVAKLARRITVSTQTSDFQNLLLQNGKIPSEDDFIEAHIWGSLTIRAVERVIISPRLKRRSRSLILKAFREKLKQVDVDLEIFE
jgi:hypothetical protein